MYLRHANVQRSLEMSHLEARSETDVTALDDVQLQFFSSALFAQLVAVIAKALVHASLSRLNISAESANVRVASFLKNSISAHIVGHDFLHYENFLLACLQRLKNNGVLSRCQKKNNTPTDSIRSHVLTWSVTFSAFCVRHCMTVPSQAWPEKGLQTSAQSRSISRSHALFSR